MTLATWADFLYNKKKYWWEAVKITVSKAKKEANERYFKKAYAQVKLSMPKEEAATLATYCEEKGYTKAGFIRQAIKEKMERDN